MLTFTSAVGKLTIRVLGQHHSLLQVISQSYCQVFVKSYNFVFEKINIAYAPYQMCQKTRSSVHIHYINTPRVLSKIHPKTAFLHNISIVSTNMTMTLFRKHFFMEQNNSQRPYRPKIAGILFVCNDPAQLLACKVNTLPLKAARDGCATVWTACRRQRWWCHRVDRSYITTWVLVSELSDRQKQQTRDQYNRRGAPDNIT